MLRTVGSAVDSEGDGLRGEESVFEESVDDVKHFKHHSFAKICVLWFSSEVCVVGQGSRSLFVECLLSVSLGSALQFLRN